MNGLLGDAKLDRHLESGHRLIQIAANFGNLLSTINVNYQTHSI
jgi:hypothetical protein